MNLRARLARGLAVALCLAMPVASLAQAWPSKPIRLIMPFPGSSSVDVVARLVAQKMSESLGQPVVVEPRPGANGMIGSDVVAKSAPDGYTLQIATPSTHVTSLFLSKNVPYDPVKDFTPITAAVEPATCLAVYSDLPVKNVAELVEYAKRNPGRLSYSSSGIGSVFHMTGEIFNQAAGTNLLHVPYRGAAAALIDLIAGRVPVAFVAVGDALPQARAGKLRILAVLEASRYAGLPDVPTVGETLPGFQKPASWFGFFGPAGLPPALVARVHAEIIKALNAPDVRARLGDGAMIVIGNTPEKFAAMLKNGIDVYGRLIKAAGIQPE